MGAAQNSCWDCVVCMERAKHSDKLHQNIKLWFVLNHPHVLFVKQQKDVFNFFFVSGCYWHYCIHHNFFNNNFISRRSTAKAWLRFSFWEPKMLEYTSKRPNRWSALYTISTNIRSIDCEETLFLIVLALFRPTRSNFKYFQSIY